MLSLLLGFLSQGWSTLFVAGLRFNCQGCSTKRLTAKWCCCVSKGSGKRKNQRIQLLLGQLLLGPRCTLGPALSDDGKRWLVGNHCALHKELVGAPWSLTSQICVQISVGLVQFAGTGKSTTRAWVPAEPWSHLSWGNQMGEKCLTSRVPWEHAEPACN